MRQVPLMLKGALLLLGAACAGRSEVPPDLVPAPLVAALLAGQGDATRGPRDITAGRVPPGFPEALVPTGPVEIVGGVVLGREIVAIFADSTRPLAAVLEEQFQRAGFEAPPRDASPGFLASYGTPGFRCSQDATVSARPLGGAQRHHVRVSYRRYAGGTSPCAKVVPEPAARQRQLALPALMPPASVRVLGGRGSAGDDHVESNAAMSGSGLVPATIVAHYAAQLAAAGWTAHEPAVSARAAAQYFEAVDPDGRIWDGILAASGSDSALALKLTMQPRSRR